MAKIVIRLAGQTDAHGPLAHRFRNLGEDVFRHVRDNGWGAVGLGEVDRSTDQFFISNVQRSRARLVTGWVIEEAIRQSLDVSVEVL